MANGSNGCLRRGFEADGHSVIRLVTHRASTLLLDLVAPNPLKWSAVSSGERNHGNISEDAERRKKQISYSRMNSKRINVGFQYKGTSLLGFELKITKKADIYMLIFERGHRRMHISYHSDGRLHYKSDRPKADGVIIETDFPTGRMEPLVKRKVPPAKVVQREEVATTGWGMSDVENAGLNEFSPNAEDVLIVQPDALSLGFCVSVVGPEWFRRVAIGSDPIIERRYVNGVVKLEIEVFDWLAQ